MDTYFMHTDMYILYFKEMFNILIMLLMKLKGAEVEGCESSVFLENN
jgi:hypothetical protein